MGEASDAAARTMGRWQPLRMAASALAVALLALACAFGVGGQVAYAAGELGVPSHTKTVTENKDANGNWDGTYTVSLDVTGNSTGSTTTETTPLDIALVLDVSGSMARPIEGDQNDVGNYEAVDSQDLNEYELYYVRVRVNNRWKMLTAQYNPAHNAWYGDDGQGATAEYNPNQQTFYRAKKSKLDALKEAVNSFISSTEKANEAAGQPVHSISLIKFAGNKAGNVGNGFYTNDDGYYANNSQVIETLAPTTKEQAAKLTADVNSMTALGATAADYGMQHAQAQLSGGSANARKVVVFFTDGEPNHQDGFDESVANDAVSTALVLKRSGTSVYTVGVVKGADPSDTSKGINSYMNALSSNYSNASSYTDLGDGSNAGFYQAASTADQLGKIFDNISHEITAKVEYKSVAIQDALSNWFGFASVGANGAPSDFKYYRNGTEYMPDTKASVSEDGAISWKPEGDGTLDGKTTYRLTFTVRPTQDAFDQAVVGHKDDASAEGANNFYTNDNDRVKVIYKTVTTRTVDGQTTTETSEEKQASYEKPKVSLPVSNITIKKVWLDGNGGVTTAPDGIQGVTVVIKRDGEDFKTVELSQANGWMQSLAVAAGLEGHAYTVEEQNVPEGYEASVNNGSFSLDAFRSESADVTISNKKKSEVLLRVKKVDAETKKPLTGARFDLYKGESRDDALSGDAYDSVEIESPEGDAFTKKLGPGTYWLKESYVPTGYQLAKDPYKLVVSSDGSVRFSKPDNYDDLQGLSVDKATMTATVAFENTAVAKDIPTTGGIGNVPLFAGGMALVAGAVALVARSRSNS